MICIGKNRHKRREFIISFGVSTLPGNEQKIQRISLLSKTMSYPIQCLDFQDQMSDI
jgi:hypothetical protein